MFQIRPSSERGLGDHGWLKSRHTFSFADYYDAHQMGFRSLRVINEDRIAGGTGFGAHPHRDMEIISYVVSGALKHQDSLGTSALIKPGEVQRMSAGTGVVHSEYNAEPNKETHFFQIWIQPNSRGGNPDYGQKSFEAELNKHKLVLILSESGRDGSIGIKQDADLYIAKLRTDDEVSHTLANDRGAWIQIISGKIDLNGTTLVTGDGVAVQQEQALTFRALESAEFLLFDLA